MQNQILVYIKNSNTKIMKMKFKRLEANGLCFHKSLLVSRVLILALQMGLFNLESSVIRFLF